MKLQFKFLPILITSYPPGTQAKVPQECIVFPCFRCKNYIRQKFVKENVFIVDIDDIPIGFKLQDGCTIHPSFTYIQYNSDGKSTCPKFEIDYGIGRKL